MNVAGTRALLEPPAGLDAAVPGELPPLELPPLELDAGWGLAPPELGLVVLVRLGRDFLEVVLVVGVLVDDVVLEVADAGAGLAAVELLVAFFEPPQPAIASAAINAPES